MAERFKPMLSAILSLLILGMALSSCGDFGFTVHVLYGENGRGDRGLNDISFLGVLEGRDALDATVVQWTPLDQDEAGYLLTSVLAEPLRSPDELIILVGEMYNGLVSQVECQFRDRKVLHIEGSDSGCTKVLSVDFLTYAPSYVAGVAAGTAQKGARLTSHCRRFAVDLPFRRGDETKNQCFVPLVSLSASFTALVSIRAVTSARHIRDS